MSPFIKRNSEIFCLSSKVSLDIKLSIVRNVAARAGAYLKLKQYDNAFTDLNKAAEINYD